jgi:glycosyltransferase involved in cell wall biosynthesis
VKVALVHDWLVAQRGGEQVLLELARLFPDAPIYTLVHQPGAVHPELEAHPIHTSPVQGWPLAPRRFRQYLPLFPAAVATFDLSAFDLVISTSHCVAKAVRTHPGQVHVSYVHTPMRYVWDQMPHYLASLPAAPLTAPVARLGAAVLRRWDIATAGRPDVLLANSEFVRGRIRRDWGRDARVLHPPVDVDFYEAAPERDRRGLLVVSALVPYKQVEVAIAVARARGLPMTVVGDGSERARLERLAAGHVRFAGALDRERLRDAYASAEVLLFPAEEDFGIVPVEAMAAGCPVAALGAGGVLETVVGEGAAATGAFFTESTAENAGAAVEAVLAARARGAMSRAMLVSRARVFDRAHFIGGIERVLSEIRPPETRASDAVRYSG